MNTKVSSGNLLPLFAHRYVRRAYVPLFLGLGALSSFGFITTGEPSAQDVEQASLQSKSDARPSAAPSAPLKLEDLMAAVARGDYPTVLLFSQGGFPLDRATTTGLTPLHIAAAHNRTAIASFLLRHGADVDAADEDGITPLMTAALTNNNEVAQQLIEARAVVNTISRDGRSALHHAVSAGSDEVAVTLIKAGSTVDSADLGGATPLALATDSQDEMISGALLSAGANPNQVVAGNQPILLMSIIRGNNSMVKMLLERGADANVVLRQNGNYDPTFVELMRGRSMESELKSDSNITALMLAAGLGNAPAVRELLDHGAERYRLSGKWRNTPLDYAAARAHVAAMQTLLLKKDEPVPTTRVIISISRQTVTVFAGDKAIETSPCSTGRTGFDTPKGSYVVTQKYETWTSTLYHSQMPHFLRLSCRAFGMHAGVLPGYPASHGCIRLPSNKAASFYKTLALGTPVSIVD